MGLNMGDSENRYGIVLATSRSDTYHFKSPESQSTLSNDSAACEMSNKISTSSDLREMSLEQALNEGKEHCSDCIRCISRFSDVDIKKCNLCGMVDVVVNSEFEIMNLEDTPSTLDEAVVCSECIIKLKYLYEN